MGSVCLRHHSQPYRSGAILPSFLYRTYQINVKNKCGAEKHLKMHNAVNLEMDRLQDDIILSVKNRNLSLHHRRGED